MAHGAVNNFNEAIMKWPGSLMLVVFNATDFVGVWKGHVSDSYGATATSLTDVHGESVAVRVAGWDASSNGSVRVATDEVLLYIYFRGSTGPSPK